MQGYYVLNISLILLLLLLAATTSVVHGGKNDNRPLVAIRWANILAALSLFLFIWAEVKVIHYISYVVSGLAIGAYGSYSVLRAGLPIARFYLWAISLLSFVGYYISIYFSIGWHAMHVTAVISTLAAIYGVYYITKNLKSKLKSHRALIVTYYLLFFILICRSLLLVFSDELGNKYNLMLLAVWPPLCAGVTIFVITSYLEEAYAEMVLMAHKDPLTNIFNRAGFSAHAETHIGRARRDKEPFCFIVSDLDKFKVINDTYGHKMGDEVIKAFVEIVKNETRSDAILGRFGGDEFIIGLPNTSQEEAVAAMHRVKDKIAETEIRTNAGDVIAFSASFGGGVMTSNHDIEKLFVKADAALYQAKRTGRNRIQFLA